MYLEKLFKAQQNLDDRIVKKHYLHDNYLLDYKILALQVELGELANEWRGFKFWSEDQESRTEDSTWHVASDSIKKYEDTHHRYYTAEVYKKRGRNPLLEEYVDCLHFILSIGNELNVTPVICDLTLRSVSIVNQFNGLFNSVSKIRIEYMDVLMQFVGLGEMLGFTDRQIEQAYYDKNKINHERQDSGY